MASLQEAFGCSFSETPFEVIDEHFKLNDEPEKEQEIIEKPKSECESVYIHNMKCPFCRERNSQKDMTNMLLLVTIGLLLFMILEKRMK